jgi:hypothetical protein
VYALKQETGLELPVALNLHKKRKLSSPTPKPVKNGQKIAKPQTKPNTAKSNLRGVFL